MKPKNQSSQTQKPMRTFSVKNIIKRQKITFQKQVQSLRKDYFNKHRFKQMIHSEKKKNLSKSKLHNKDKLQVLPEKQRQNIGNFLQPTKIISVTAPKWALFDFYSGTYIRGYRSHDTHDLSTFSKLLVFCAINALIIKHKIDLDRFQCIVTQGSLKWVEQQFNYKSIVEVDDIISLQDALHLMLMSEGFEYELIIGLNIGAYLQKKQKKQYYSVYDANDKMFKTHLGLFYELVNSYCKFLKLENVKYVQHDPNLRKQTNSCSAYDVAIISIQCLKIPMFMQILKKSNYICTIKYINDDGHMQKKIVQLINKSVANPFISYFNVNRNWGEKQFMCSNCSVYFQDQDQDDSARPIVLVLLGAYSPADRQKDIQQVVQWYLKNKDSNPAIRKNLNNLLDKDKKAEKYLNTNSLKISTTQLKRLKTDVQPEIDAVLSQKLSIKSNEKTKYDEFGKINNLNKLKTLPNQ